jgi:ribonuclease T2
MVFALLLAPLAGCAEPARFDYYLLALSVAPAFCENEPRSAARSRATRAAKSAWPPCARRWPAPTRH